MEKGFKREEKRIIVLLMTTCENREWVDSECCREKAILRLVVIDL